MQCNNYLPGGQAWPSRGHGSLLRRLPGCNQKLLPVYASDGLSTTQNTSKCDQKCDQWCALELASRHFERPSVMQAQHLQVFKSEDAEHMDEEGPLSFL